MKKILFVDILFILKEKPVQGKQNVVKYKLMNGFIPVPARMNKAQIPEAFKKLPGFFIAIKRKKVSFHQKFFSSATIFPYLCYNNVLC
jgi:hypothetical protein